MITSLAHYEIDLLSNSKGGDLTPEGKKVLSQIFLNQPPPLALERLVPIENPIDLSKAFLCRGSTIF
jgi:hypothetical protein